MSKLRILYVANAYPPHFIGGAELIAHYHAKTLRDIGHEVAVFAGDHSGDKLAELRFGWFESVPVWRFGVGSVDFDAGTATPFLNPVAQKEFVSVLETFRPDIVHCHNLIGLGAGLILEAKSRGIHVALTVHDHWGFCLRNTFLRQDGRLCNNATECYKCQATFRSDLHIETPIRLRRDFIAWAIKCCDLILSPSQYLASTYNRNMVGRLGEEVKVLWNGVNLDSFKHLNSSKVGSSCSFTIVSYLGEHKGVVELLEAFVQIADLDVTLNIVGVGHLEQAMRERVDAAGISSRVRFWGRVPNSQISEVYAQTDVYVLPSVWPENQPVSITEAMASGLPVIATNSGGIPELIQDGINGLLCVSGDVNSLRDAMRNLATNPDLRRQMGNAGRELISTHGFVQQMKDLLAHYDSLLSRNGGLPAHARKVLCHGRGWDTMALETLNSVDHDNSMPDTLFMSREWMVPGSEDSHVHWAVSLGGIESAIYESASNGAQALIPMSAAELAESLGYRAKISGYLDVSDCKQSLIRD